MRGARQVGKTYLVEAFGKSCFESVLTVNLEQKDDLHPLFERMEAKRMVQELGLYFNQTITQGKTLLFFDEIQACPKAITALRYFYEETPDLHVIAADSLLDFALREFKHSLPVVGRWHWDQHSFCMLKKLEINARFRKACATNWNCGLMESDYRRQRLLLGDLLAQFFTKG